MVSMTVPKFKVQYWTFIISFKTASHIVKYVGELFCFFHSLMPKSRSGLTPTIHCQIIEFVGHSGGIVIVMTIPGLKQSQIAATKGDESDDRFEKDGEFI